MNLYLLTQNVNDDYDTYDSCIVSAESEEEARNMHPEGGREMDDVFDFYVWANPSDVEVKLIGKTTEPKGVVLASFNAG